MAKQTQQENEKTAFDQVLATADEAKTKIKEAGQALTGLSQALKALEREQKAKDKEVAQAHAAIQKIQSLKLAA